MIRPYQVCTRCIMDISDPLIVFDEDGYCNHCTEALNRINEQLLPLSGRAQALDVLIDKIKKEGKGKPYNCIIGLSGGVDSSTVAYWVSKLGLNPLAIHFDNGWNSELSVDNINMLVDKLKIDLYTYVVDWSEFRDLQLAYIKSSVANCEAPTDHAISALLWNAAKQHKVKYVLTGSNLATESIMPYSWGHYNQDLKNIRAIHKQFGTMPLKTFPTRRLDRYFYDVFVKRIRFIPFLNYLDYNKDQSKQMLISEIGWRDYGGKHYESIWTRFFQGYYLPVKFGFDKRRPHLSSMICAGLLSREEALAEMEKASYDENLLQNDMEFVLKKFDFTMEQFEKLMKTPPRPATDFPSHYYLFHIMAKYKNIFRKIATSG
ncbi:MAG: N-acetyl sugar amidotransferase [Syntrophomonas sp.]